MTSTSRTGPTPPAPARVRELCGPPATLRTLVRAVLPSVPGVGSLPGVRHTGSVLPDLVLVRPQVRVQPADLAAYRRGCGFGLTDILPPTYPHVLAFGLQLSLLNDPEFPFTPLGLVHLDNTITQHRPIGADEVLDVRVHAAASRPHPRGQLVDLVSTAYAGATLVWEETTTLLSRGPGDRAVSADSPVRALAAPTGPVTWRLPADLGRRYAAVSGDVNPIHLYAWTAKAFGFSRQIAHGMWTKARCLAALPGRLPDAYTVEVAFKKPIPLPGTVLFGVATDADDALFFGVTSPAGTEHLVGRVTPLP